jgi:hypothetical protein
MHIYYCTECIDKISPHFEVFHRLCQVYLSQKCPLEICLDHSETRADAVKLMSKLRILEKLGYVLTTETAKWMIGIIPKGIEELEKGSYVFCLAKDHAKQKV